MGNNGANLFGTHIKGKTACVIAHILTQVIAATSPSSIALGNNEIQDKNCTCDGSRDILTS